MKELTTNHPADGAAIEDFSNQTDFKLPIGFIDFYNKTNGAEMRSKDGQYFIIWPLNELFKLNVDYDVLTYAPGFFIFGSDGGDLAYCIKKDTGWIYEMPFIGMSNDEANFLCQTFDELLDF